MRIFFSLFLVTPPKMYRKFFFTQNPELSRAISSFAQRSRRQCKYTESGNTQRTFSEGSLRSRSRLFVLSAWRSNEELVEGGGRGERLRKSRKKRRRLLLRKKRREFNDIPDYGGT